MFTGLSGTGGVVRVGGRQAATLTGWSVRFDPGPREYVISAGVTDVVPVYLSPSYRAEIRLQMAKRMWRWQGVSLSVEDNRIDARCAGEPDVM